MLPGPSTTLLSRPVAVRDAQTAPDICLWRAEVCNQKAEVGESIDRAAESLPADSAHSFNGLRSKALLSRQR
jgi:hypothetical protein